MSGQGERETVQRHLLQGGIRTQHTKGGESTGQVHEGQTPEYGGTRLRHTYPVHGPEEDQYDRPRTGQQGDAPIGHRVQPEEVPEIRTKTGKKRGGTTCFDGSGQKCAPKPVSSLHDASEFGLPFLSRQEKSPVKGLVFNLYFENHRLVQRLPLLAVVFLSECLLFLFQVSD